MQANVKIQIQLGWKYILVANSDVCVYTYLPAETEGWINYGFGKPFSENNKVGCPGF